MWGRRGGLEVSSKVKNLLFFNYSFSPQRRGRFRYLRIV